MLLWIGNSDKESLKIEVRARWRAEEESLLIRPPALQTKENIELVTGPADWKKTVSISPRTDLCPYAWIGDAVLDFSVSLSLCCVNVSQEACS